MLRGYRREKSTFGKTSEKVLFELCLEVISTGIDEVRGKRASYADRNVSSQENKAHLKNRELGIF